MDLRDKWTVEVTADPDETEVRFVHDSPLEETVLSELVSEPQIPW